MTDGTIRIPINESTDDHSQIELADLSDGSGVRHKFRLP